LSLISNNNEIYLFGIGGKGKKYKTAEQDYEEHDKRKTLKVLELSKQILNLVNNRGKYYLKEIDVDNMVSTEVRIFKEKMYVVSIKKNNEENKFEIKKPSELVLILEEAFSETRLLNEQKRLKNGGKTYAVL